MMGIKADVARAILTRLTQSAMLVAISAGCGGGTTDEIYPSPPSSSPPACPAENIIHETCAGVPASPICDNDVCADGVSCDRVVTVTSAPALANALADAGAGTCIALAPGDYGSLSMPAGVRLLGRYAGDVRLTGLSFGQGSGAYVRGVSVLGGGIRVEGATGVTIDSVLVQDSIDDGIHVEPGATLTIKHTEVLRSARYGVFSSAHDAIEMYATIIDESEGAGLWADCGAPDCCTSTATPLPWMSVDSTIIRENRLAGMSIQGVDTALEHVAISGTRVSVGDNPGQFGGGLTVAACSRLSARDVRLEDNSYFGVLLESSEVTFGEVGSGQGSVVSGNRVGVWVRNVPQGVPTPMTMRIENADIRDNDGVGVGFDKDSQGIIFCRSSVSSTRMRLEPVEKDGSIGYFEEVGDGISWLEGAGVTVEDVSLYDNMRTSLLINGSASGFLTNVTVSGVGSEVLQQSFPSGGASPVVSGETPMLQTSPMEVYPVRIAPAAFGSGQ